METGLLKGSIGLIGTQIMGRIIFRYPCFIHEGNRKEDVRIIYVSRPEKCVLSVTLSNSHDWYVSGNVTSLSVKNM